FSKNFDLGFAKDSVIGIPISSESQFEVFTNAIKNHPAVASISASQNHIHFSGPLRTVRSADQEREARILNVGFNYVETMSLKLKEGRSFEERFTTDRDESVLINETLMKEMGWAHAVGQSLVIAEKTYRVVGVLEDYYSEGLWRPIRPVVFGVAKPSVFAFIEIRLNPGFMEEGSKFFQTTWEKLFPEVPYDGFFQDVVVAESTQVSEGINRMFQWISGMAIIIAAMGLFALVALSLARRTKEIGIRKVMGASIVNIMTLVNKEFIIMLGISVLLADALGYYMVKSLLDSIYTFHVDVEIMALIISNGLVFIVALLTISSQVWKAANENPIHALKYE
ncbi:ABC transporter permease, partial [bacterium]|nr:ABC transporter permease [bacterium]